MGFMYTKYTFLVLSCIKIKSPTTYVTDYLFGHSVPFLRAENKFFFPG